MTLVFSSRGPCHCYATLTIDESWILKLFTPTTGQNECQFSRSHCKSNKGMLDHWLMSHHINHSQVILHVCPRTSTIAVDCSGHILMPRAFETHHSNVKTHGSHGHATNQRPLGARCNIQCCSNEIKKLVKDMNIQIRESLLEFLKLVAISSVLHLMVSYEAGSRVVMWQKSRRSGHMF